MKRTTADGHDTNRYTEGNPSLGVPATVVGAEEMNNIQEEIVNVVEAAGITLDGGDEDQLLEALGILGGAGWTQLKQTIANNQSVAADVTGLLIDSSDYKSAIVYFDIFRRTDSSNVKEVGIIYIAYNDETAAWDITYDSHFDDAEIVFSITAGGQVQYTSSNMAGASYSGTLRITNIVKNAT